MESLSTRRWSVLQVCCKMGDGSNIPQIANSARNDSIQTAGWKMAISNHADQVERKPHSSPQVMPLCTREFSNEETRQSN